MIPSIPTTYRRIEYRSRLEARWAVFLDHHPSVARFSYEPQTFSYDLPPSRYSRRVQTVTYTPDFLVQVRSESPYLHDDLYLEVKPSEPSDEYITTINLFLHLIPNLYIVYGSFYDNSFSVCCLSNPAHSSRLSSLMRSCPDAVSLAAQFRFDLRHT